MTIYELSKMLDYLDKLKSKGGLTHKNIVMMQKKDCTTYNIEQIEKLYTELKAKYE